MKNRKITVIAIAVVIALSGCSNVAVDSDVKGQITNPVEDSEEVTATETDIGVDTVSENDLEETTETSPSNLSRLYNLSLTDDIEDIMEKYSIGYSAEYDETDLLYNGDIGEMKDPYKGIDLNGDGVTDSISRISDDNEDEQVNVKYFISIKDGPEVTTPTATNYKNVLVCGGDVFEFNDINNDGYDEVLYANYYSSTAGFGIKDACLYYVSGDKWNRFDFCDELEGVVGAELTDDGIVFLVDYADKWSCCFDVFLYKMNGDKVSCTENDSLLAKTYWPIRWEYSPSLISDFDDGKKAALSEVVGKIFNTGMLPDGTDISRFLEATKKETEDGLKGGYMWISPVDLGQKNEFGINIWGGIRNDPDDPSSDEGLERMFAYNMDDKEVFTIGDEKISSYYRNGYIITHSDDYSKYSACRYDPTKRGFDVLCTTNDMWGDEMTSAIGDNELISNPPMISINRNYELYKKLGSRLEIIDNGRKSLEESEEYNYYY